MRYVQFVFNARLSTLKITSVCDTPSELNINNAFIVHLASYIPIKYMSQ
jgi:hypothetical protein